MKHIQQKNDWLSYEFKPYFFILIGLIGLISKKNLNLTTGQNVIAYISIAFLFVISAKIIVWRSQYRTRASRN